MEIQFQWNTSEFTRGNYILIAYVEPLPAYGNSCIAVYAVIHAGILGDINADRTVNILDAVFLSAAAGSKPGD